MANQRIQGAVEEFEGKAKRGLGRVVGDSKLQVDGAVKEVSGRAKNAYGRVIDGLDDMVDQAPSDVREPARKALDFAREKPLLTVGIIAGAAVVLSALGRKN
ncbi:CsbD family protein [Brevundimonas diminuta]|uniref:CsbD family protein n=1 Tax=Brevundimonas diminuta TaxID=293 RepID=UPI003D015493